MEAFKFKISDHINFTDDRTEYTATPTSDGNVLVTWEDKGVMYTEAEVNHFVNDEGYWIVI